MTYFKLTNKSILSKHSLPNHSNEECILLIFRIIWPRSSTSGHSALISLCTLASDCEDFLPGILALAECLPFYVVGDPTHLEGWN